MLCKEEVISLNKKRRKGSALLISAIISVGISAILSFGIAKMEHYNFNTLQHYESVSQAQRYAHERAEIIRVTPFENLQNIQKRSIGSVSSSATGMNSFYEEVNITNSANGILKDCVINIYSGSDTNKALVSLVVRKADPEALVNGGILASYNDVSSGMALSAKAVQDLMSSKIGEGLDSESFVSSMSSKIFKDYIEGVLVNYQKKDSAVKRSANSSVGSVISPIYIDNDGYARKTSINYRFLNNTTTDAVGLLEIDGSGNFYLDYEDKTSFFDSGL